MTTTPTIAQRLDELRLVLARRRRLGETTLELDLEWLDELLGEARERIRELARQYVDVELRSGSLWLSGVARPVADDRAPERSPQ